MAKESCSICGRPAAEEYRPFCCKRCADIDLARWLAGHYRIPAVEPPDGFEMAEEYGEEER